MSKVKAKQPFTDIERIFNDLQRHGGSTKNIFLAANLPFTKTHKIGISEEGYPVFFIESSFMGDIPSINLDLISVQYTQRCNLKINDDSLASYYTIVHLKSVDSELIKYYVDIMSLILIKIGDHPKQQHLINELKTLVDLFRLFSNSPMNSIQGLWAELFVMVQSSNPSYLVKSWHVSVNDVYDFNDGFNKIEVKSTIKRNRVHHFSNEQLTPNRNSQLAVCSIMMTITGQGISVFDLKDSIEERLDVEDRLQLNKLIIKTLGSDFEKATETFFDYQKALDSYKIYNSNNIPSIDIDLLSNEISNLHFDCDLSNVEEASDSFLETSELFKILK